MFRCFDGLKLGNIYILIDNIVLWNMYVYDLCSLENESLKLIDFFYFGLLNFLKLKFWI